MLPISTQKMCHVCCVLHVVLCSTQLVLCNENRKIFQNTHIVRYYCTHPILDQELPYLVIILRTSNLDEGLDFLVVVEAPSSPGR